MRAKFGRGPTVVSKKCSLNFINRYALNSNIPARSAGPSPKETYYKNAEIEDFLSQEFVCNR